MSFGETNAPHYSTIPPRKESYTLAPQQRMWLNTDTCREGLILERPTALHKKRRGWRPGRKGERGSWSERETEKKGEEEEEEEERLGKKGTLSISLNWGKADAFSLLSLHINNVRCSTVEVD